MNPFSIWRLIYNNTLNYTELYEFANVIWNLTNTAFRDCPYGIPETCNTLFLVLIYHRGTTRQYTTTLLYLLGVLLSGKGFHHAVWKYFIVFIILMMATRFDSHIYICWGCCQTNIWIINYDDELLTMIVPPSFHVAYIFILNILAD